LRRYSVVNPYAPLVRTFIYTSASRRLTVRARSGADLESRRRLAVSPVPDLLDTGP
jgi:hypothetical protein